MVALTEIEAVVAEVGARHGACSVLWRPSAAVVLDSDGAIVETVVDRLEPVGD